ncbi:MAG TPA: hypothetical protein VEJ23_10060 [Solirubrobacteraceae bacterium]|nr:hypothetical protein [Solirubrobacteraceae bacterium]
MQSRSVYRNRRPSFRDGRRVAARAGLVGLAIGAGLGGAAPGAPLPQTAHGASATATIHVAFKSVTLSTTSLSYANCTGGSSSGGALGFPNGSCETGKVTVTNAGAPSTVLIAGADALPSDGGKAWRLCGGGGSPACASLTPGSDQYSETYLPGHLLGITAVCDADFATGGICGDASASQSSVEALRLVGPVSSSDHSAIFTTHITWIAN